MEREECIYNLIPKPPPVVVKEPLHVSKFAGNKEFETAKKRAHGTMGQVPEQIKRSPKNYVKKGQYCKQLPPQQKVSPHGNETLKKPPVPSHKISPKSPEKPKRNYVLDNWKAAPKTKKVHPEVAQTFYTDKKDYGKVPKYLSRVKKEAAAEQQYWEEVKESMQPEDTETRCRLLSEEERIEILNGLKANLADIKKKHAALRFGQDSLSFRRKKEQMEADMAELEADIKTFSRQNVYITEN
ncbi:enkurin [Histomonas meleagridis]|uniref:enkurin n=1 Tax=Histomonas meleagridis TaxID=135588 RepID=UPI00355AB859|nr:enkurin [Histomonas meleagridis]KAH0804028.1 enkurin [Histomonas meleagridis]